jgi:outer membrane protein OmpA-like peptidoglycan-associated protein
MQNELKENARALKGAVENARAARDEATRAADAASQQAAARTEAEQARLSAEAARESAIAAAENAKIEAARTQEELAAMRKRREAELNRMQEALNKVAPTRRTPSGMIIELANDSFYFDFDKADLRPENREILSRIAGILLASEGYRIFVYGHTDDTGSAEYNKALSERRARSVGDYLTNAGVPDNVLEVQGFGKSQPRAANTTQAGRQKNRRVEIGIVDSIIEYQGVAPDAAKSDL